MWEIIDFVILSSWHETLWGSITHEKAHEKGSLCISIYLGASLPRNGPWQNAFRLFCDALADPVFWKENLQFSKIGDKWSPSLKKKEFMYHKRYFSLYQMSGKNGNFRNLQTAEIGWDFSENEEIRSWGRLLSNIIYASIFSHSLKLGS